MHGGTAQLWHTRRLDATASRDHPMVVEVPIDHTDPDGFDDPTARHTWWPVDAGPARPWPVSVLEARRGGAVVAPDGRELFFGVEARVQSVPHWLVATAAAAQAVMLLAARHRSRRRRAAAGLCPA